ncbi:hypothetical protein C8Q79DRAFT_1114299 [Trametes meyenii]|nr:hypothetical protein C8Q79DRAFT_1114299 [Trametes meyenii]
MAFAISSYNIRLGADATLLADAYAVDGNPLENRLDLDAYIGSTNGQFDVFDSHFSRFACDVQYDDHHHTLRASFPQAEAESDGTAECATATLYLNMFVTNDDGVLKFIPPPDGLIESCTCIHLHKNFLYALCLGADGRLHSSQIDLGKCYSSNNGSFVHAGGRDRPYTFASSNVRLQVSAEEGVYLYARLRCSDGSYNDAWTKLDDWIKNNRGRLVDTKERTLETQPTDFFGHIPFIGSVVGGAFHAATLPRGTSILYFLQDSPVLCASLMVIAVLLGGVCSYNAGVGLMGPLYSATSEVVEDEDSLHGLSPEEVEQLSEAKLGRYMFEHLSELLAPGISADFGLYLSCVSEGDFRAAFEAVVFGVGRAKGHAVSITRVDVFSGYIWMNKLADALVNGDLPLEWAAA